jgi:hypothetical protein
MADTFSRKFYELATIVSVLVASSSVALAANCSTVSGARGIIANGRVPSDLASAIARWVPPDPSHCVPALCEAARGESFDVQVAVGAGISEAYSTLVGVREDDALALLSSACSISCSENIVTAFAASQATSVKQLCDASLSGAQGTVDTIYQVNADGGGGGASSH